MNPFPAVHITTLATLHLSAALPPPPPDTFQIVSVVDATDETGEVFHILEAEASREGGNDEGVSGAAGGAGGGTTAAAGAKVARKGKGTSSDRATPVIAVSNRRPDTDGTI